MRNFFAIIAIILTTVLFCCLFTIAGSMIKSIEESSMRQTGNSAHGSFINITEEQYKKISVHPDIKEISYSVFLAVAGNEKLAKRPAEICYAKDELEARITFSMPTTGRLPEAENELATDTLVLKKLGISAKLGEAVTIKYVIGEKEYTKDFTLVGFWEGDIVSSVSKIWVSEAYVKSVIDNFAIAGMDGRTGAICADVNFYETWDLDANFSKVITESGYSIKDVLYRVNGAYIDNSSMDVETILGIVLIILAIICCGYLMISNVFLISITKDVRFYGLLKTIGTTGRQIKKMINRQAMKICIIGIPVGLIIGGATGYLLTPFVLGILNTNVSEISVEWWLFVFAAMFALLTVFMSIRKSIKIASKVSPIEALRTSESANETKRTNKAGKKISILKMAWENTGRKRKKFILVTISLSLGLIILNGAYTMANSIDMDKYLNGMIGHDFVISDVSWFNMYMEYRDTDTLNDDFIKELSAHSGIESLERVYFSSKYCELDDNWNDMAKRVREKLDWDNERLGLLEDEIKRGMGEYDIYGIDDATWDDFKVWKGEINLEKLHSGEYVVVAPYDENGTLSAYEVGDSIEVFSHNGESRTCEIIAIASIPYNISVQYTLTTGASIFIPSDVFLNKVENKCPMLVTLDVHKDSIETVDKFLENYCEKRNVNMQYKSRELYKEEYVSFKRTFKVVGSVVSGILAMIGIANFANTSITSIMSRKRELAMLESIGMTARQQRNMLIMEGLIYMVAAFAVTLTIGTLLGSVGLSAMLSDSEFFTVSFTVMPSIICLPVFVLLSVVVPMLSKRAVNNLSVVERMRIVD